MTGSPRQYLRATRAINVGAGKSKVRCRERKNTRGREGIPGDCLTDIPRLGFS